MTIDDCNDGMLVLLGQRICSSLSFSMTIGS